MSDPVTFDVRGGCMRGLLRPGDRVRVRAASPAELRFGDIVVCLNDEPTRRGVLSAHRLVWKSRGTRGWTLWTKGDAQFGLDSPNPDGSLVGVVVAVQRGGRDWIALDGARALWHRAIGAASAPLALRPGGLILLDALLRLTAGPPRLKPVRRLLRSLALLLEDL
jgi:hypothetical protein